MQTVYALILSDVLLHFASSPYYVIFIYEIFFHKKTCGYESFALLGYPALIGRQPLGPIFMGQAVE